MIYIFRTSIKFKKQIIEITPKINAIKNIIKWNFDLEDCDKILRIEAKNLDKKEIINILKTKNYHCEELL